MTITVDSLANQFAAARLPRLGDPLQTQTRRRLEYDFKATGFNVSTAAAISALFVAIITSSVAFLVVSAVLYNVRNAFMRAVETTALPAPDQQAIDPALLRNRIAGHLEIRDNSWKVFKYQILDFKAWMSLTPAAPPAPEAVQRRAEAPVIAPPPEVVVANDPAVPDAEPEGAELPPLEVAPAVPELMPAYE